MCTCITLIATDGSVIQARTQEWGVFDLRSQLIVIPRGKAFTGAMPDGQPGLAWQGQYGVLGINAVERLMLVDGLNEPGLAVSGLYLPGLAEYQPYDPSNASQAIGQSDLPHWLLTTFATVDEVRAGLPQVTVVPVPEHALGDLPAPLHWMLTDASGKTLVVEYVKGQLAMYDNPVGVMTNAPEFPWHLTNLRNYVGLHATAAPAIKVGELEIVPNGVGSGMLGLPGDYTPPSRFVRAVALRNTVRTLATGPRAVEEAFRILNNFDIPLGATDAAARDDTLGATQWMSAMDTTALRLYYRTMFNSRLRLVDLKRIDFGTGDVRYQPLDREQKQDLEEVAGA